MATHLNLSQIAYQLERQATNAALGQDCHVRVSDPALLVASLRAAEAETARLRRVLEQIKSLKDGYAGGNDAYATGRKAGYRVAGDIAEVALMISRTLTGSAGSEDN